MTRINCVPPEELTLRHLVAEYRELPRVFALAAAARLRGEAADDRRNPARYTLGEGHVRFFYGRLKWCGDRQRSLIAEMERRGYHPSFTSTPRVSPEFFADRKWWGEWTPDPESLALNRARIAARLAASSQLKKELYA